MNFKALHDRVIVKMIQIEQQTASGIILAATEDRPSDTVYARVIAVGPGRAVDSGGIIPTTLQPGDVVIFKPNTAIKHLYMGDEYFILREGDIASIVDGVKESEYAQIDPKALTTNVRELESLL